MNRSTPLSSTLGALGGVGFAVLFFFSLAVIDPLKNPTNQELLTWWADVGKQRDSMISMYSMLLAAPLFLIFLVQLCNRLRSAGQSAESWSGLVFGAGVAYVALVAVTAFSRGVIAQSIRVSDEPIPGPDTLRYATALSQAAWNINALTPASLREFVFPLSATIFASAIPSMQCFITSSGTSVASFAAPWMAADRSAF